MGKEKLRNCEVCYDGKQKWLLEIDKEENSENDSSMLFYS